MKIMLGIEGQSTKPETKQVSSSILGPKKKLADLIRSTACAFMRKAVVSTKSTHQATSATKPSADFKRDHLCSSERFLNSRVIQPPPTEQCPECKRRFCIKAYGPHIKWCKAKTLHEARIKCIAPSLK